MKSSITILLLFTCLACSAQIDSAFYRKVDAEPVFKGKGSVFMSKDLVDCIIEQGPDSGAYKQCIAEFIVGVNGKTSSIKLLTDIPECQQKIAIKTVENMVFKPAILNGKPVAALSKMAINLATR
jgi:hypothetical protein